ncbi:hypothetical protein HID58_009320 [Brassica napus]|uniref:FBD domain-containing protein n=1 Tax=Brassica napus TaxID=3708 RepID=A0ABQ8DSB9_BRANA|nr:hypothetical protein HID58_009320 [Brassica napus]
MTNVKNILFCTVKYAVYFKRVSRLEEIIPTLETSDVLTHLEKLCPTLSNGTRVVLNFIGRGDKDVQTLATSCDLD